jgi:hypothetical protein
MQMRWLALLILSGCSRGSEENLGLANDRVTVDVKRLATPSELVHALQLPGSELDKRLGARHLEAKSVLKIEPFERPFEILNESFKLDADGKGAVHVIHDNARDGLEAVIANGTIYVKPRYGHWTKRKAETEDVERLRENVEGVAAAYLELLEGALQVKEAGRTEVNGRSAVRLQLSASGSQRGPSESLPYKKWRETIKVGNVNGEWLLDASSGAPLAGKMEASYTFERSGEKGPIAVTLTWEQQLSQAEPIVPPADAVEPRRERPLLDREVLLDGLAPPKSNH